MLIFPVIFVFGHKKTLNLSETIKCIAKLSKCSGTALK